MDLDILSARPETHLQNVEACLQAADQVEEAARCVARNLPDRYAIIRSINQSLSTGDIWDALHGYWTGLVPYFDAKLNVEEHVLALALGLAKLQRNLIAGLYDFQAATRPHEPLVRQLLFLLSGFNRIEDARYFTVQAILTQLLSNLVSPTSNAPEHQAVPETYLELYLSGDREADVIIRLLDSQDRNVNTATLHLIGNLTLGSPERTAKLLGPTGVSWLSRIISHIETFHAAPSSDSSQIADRRFELATAILTSFIPLNLHSRLFANLASPDEPISPSQTTYLKIIDSYIHSQSTSNSHSTDRGAAGSDVIQHRFLLPTFHLLSAYATASIQSAPDDARLPKVFEALHLVCEILCAIGLGVQAREDRRKLEAEGQEASRSMDNSGASAGGGAGSDQTNKDSEDGDEGMVREMRDPERGIGIVKPIVDTLQQLEILLPRTNPRLARTNSTTAAAASDSSAGQPHADTPPATSAPTAALSSEQIRPIASLKRILVQLLGIISFGRTEVGDQVRQAGGVVLILSMTEVDENNPYLREHALFTIRNLMQNNPANQAVIAEMDPVGVLSDTGEVLPVPERMKRNGAAGGGRTSS